MVLANIITMTLLITREVGTRTENRDMAFSKVLKANMSDNGKMTKKVEKVK